MKSKRNAQDKLVSKSANRWVIHSSLHSCLCISDIHLQKPQFLSCQSETKKKLFPSIYMEMRETNVNDYKSTNSRATTAGIKTTTKQCVEWKKI